MLDGASAPVVLVTGGAGFIGSHTVDRLLRDGARVVVLDDLRAGSRGHLARWTDSDRLRWVEADVNAGLWAPLMHVEASWGPVERIVHLAAQVSVVRSVAGPLADLQANQAATMKVLEYARVRGVKQVVFASSAAVYGDPDTVPVHEQLPARPLSPYGIHKHASELYLRYVSREFGVPCTPLRFFNAYGPRQDASSPYSGVISAFCRRAVQGEGLRIDGDGQQTRDFVYVEDLADAVVTAVWRDEGDGWPINIGTGRSTTILQLAQAVLRVAEQPADITHAPPRAADIRHSTAVVERAAEQLGWRASTSLDEGLRRTVAWMREQG